MTEATQVANHLLENILRDLMFLKENNFIQAQAYKDVVNILPNRISEANKPPLPTRKSTNSSNVSLPIPHPREIPQQQQQSFPKLPGRRTNDWGQQQQPSSPAQLPVIMPSTNITKNILQSAEPTPAAPPAYSQKPTEPTSLATAEALYDYHGEDPSTDLSFKQGDIIEVTEYVNDDWWKGTVKGRSGIFPQNHVKKVAPAFKAKRPWVPPTSAKPNFSTSSNTQQKSSPQMYNQQAPVNNTMPYSYPPPPTAMYQAPPMQPPATVYAQPSAVAVNHEEEEKKPSMMKKVGGKVAESAIFGFGATVGSEVARSIF